MLWLMRTLPLSQENASAMRNTDYNIDALGSFISSDATLEALRGMIDDLGLEVEDVRPL